MKTPKFEAGTCYAESWYKSTGHQQIGYHILVVTKRTAKTLVAFILHTAGSGSLYKRFRIKTDYRDGQEWVSIKFDGWKAPIHFFARDVHPATDHATRLLNKNRGSNVQ